MIAALAVWVPAPWAAPVRVSDHGAVAHYHAGAWTLHGRDVGRMVPCDCRAGYAIRNLTRGRLTVRYIAG